MSAGTVARTAAAAAVAARAGHALTRWLPRHVPGGAGRWDRRNHRGDVVTLLEGPAVALAAGAGAATAAAPWGRAGATAVLAAAVFGAVDDLGERRGERESGARGLAGHLTALRRGRLTTGALKVLGLGATGVACAALVAPRPPRRAGELADAAVGAALVAGSANLLNLLDLRPGRAAKVAVVVAASLGTGSPGSAGALRARPLAAAGAGAAVAVLPGDLAGRSMLGDTGANALGALLGVACLARWDRAGRIAALGVVTGLTLASERVSFSRVIEASPLLRELDRLGRP
ncbi:hypothetical protein MO973_34540 [Paenibacillus sp. TRM 82003]|uniref:hypothetical protein n=1 Tax=Kineococcus sp. TRM81007 TaxID=2925831 RepID=UPI001F572011|nr:hypothetical protein [Kineococcus sp. TRM81007]MCI2240733.1 hypothetical protein [Kineococcus sp. TRM81007]MCI3925343.1 hypothetical protein [Paenibacillus sp. TRM 82003]